MRFQVRATSTSAQILDFDLDDEVTVLDEASTSVRAVEIASELFDKLSKSYGQHVYNYTSIEAYDSKNDEVIETFEFDTDYVTDTEATLAFDSFLDEYYGEVSVAGVGMPTSYVLAMTNRSVYLAMRGIFLSETNKVVVD